VFEGVAFVDVFLEKPKARDHMSEKMTPLKAIAVVRLTVDTVDTEVAEV